MAQTIVCPNCQTNIDLDKIGEERYKVMLQEQEKKLQQQAVEKQKEFDATLEKEREEMRKKAQVWAEEKMREQAKKDAVEMDDLKNRLAEQEKQKEEMQKNELEMRKKARELEEKQKQFDLEMQRKLDEERVKLEEKMGKMQEEALAIKIKQIDEEGITKIKQRDEEYRKKELEWAKKEEQMKKSMDDLRRKTEQGSQQIQGDVQEQDLKQVLQMAFPLDKIEDVATGIKGADIVQIVRNGLGQEVGVIIWESKNTKAWSDDWVSKLKDDKIRSKANIAIIVTSVLPKEMKNFGLVDDIFVALPEFSLQVATLMRDKILSISKIEKSLEGKDAKMEMLYRYLTSDEFGSKINGIVDAFQKLKFDLDSEKRAMERIWKRREKELERVIMSTSMMYGDFEGMIGQSLPKTSYFELGAGEEGEE